jgi:RNA polymerase sigma-70 factor (ECF subfamily)
MPSKSKKVCQFESISVLRGDAQPRTSPRTDSSDARLIDRFQDGNPEVFDLLYLRHHSRIHGVILSIISNPDDALDLTQDVFLKAYQSLNSFKKASQFYSWLYRIAINSCVDYMRRRPQRRTVSDSPISDDVFYHPESARHLPSPSKRLEHEELSMFLQRAVMELTPKQKQVFLLRYKEELPLKAIAHRLGRSIGTVKAHLFQVHRTLHHQLLPYFQFAL